LKNSLSIINEGAGLLEDIGAMTVQGAPLDPERLVSLGRKVRRQVQRTDAIIKRMNQFAHTVDTLLDVVDLALLLRRTCDLTERLTAMRGVVVTVEEGSEPVSVVAPVFLLQNVIWKCLDFVSRHSKPGERLTLSAAKATSGARIRLQAVSSPDPTALDRYWPVDSRSALLNALGAEMIFYDPDQVWYINLPDDVRDRKL
jgi:hypothetical protein